VTGLPPELEDVSCNLCGERDGRVLFDRPYQLGSMSEAGTFAATTDEFLSYGRVVSCRSCRLAYTDPRPTREALLRGYGECVDESYVEQGTARSINGHLSLNTLKRFAKEGRLLEVGASTGYFLNAARVDFDVVGLEPSAWAARIARERFKLDVREAAFEPGKLEAASFDCVAMIDVIEHVVDPLETLREAARVLKPGGLLYLVTPDIGSLSARLLGASWWGLRPAHIYYFDRRTMTAMLEKAGFEVALVKSFGRIFSWGYWASRMRNYPAPVYRSILTLISGLDIEDKLLYLDTRDSMEVCARRR